MKVMDTSVITKHLQELDEVVTYLESKKKITEKDIVQDLELRFAIERALHLAIQNTIDIGNHIIASLSINNVETYADIPIKLAEAKIIPQKLSKNLVLMAKFRNILVHEYVKLEASRLHSFIINDLGDFRRFSQSIISYLRKN